MSAEVFDEVSNKLLGEFCTEISTDFCKEIGIEVLTEMFYEKFLKDVSEEIASDQYGEVDQEIPTYTVNNVESNFHDENQQKISLPGEDHVNFRILKEDEYDISEFINDYLIQRNLKLEGDDSFLQTYTIMDKHDLKNAKNESIDQEIHNAFFLKEESIKDFKIYEEIITDESSFIHEECDKQYKNEKHVDLVHEDFTYSCIQCDKKTLDEDQLADHVKLRHEGNSGYKPKTNTFLDKKPFSSVTNMKGDPCKYCETCDNDFVYKQVQKA